MNDSHIRGSFISIEGIEGVGKSTNIRFICEFLNRLGIANIATREPGGTPISEQIRDLLLEVSNKSICPMAELLMMFSGRAQHICEIIEPALASGSWVICDRFTDATYAYQGAGRGLSVDLIQQLEILVQGAIRPDLTLIFDIQTNLGLERADQRGNPDRFEREDIEFFDRARHCYLTIADASPDRCKLIDASQSIGQVQSEIRDLLEQFVASRT